MKEKKKVAAMQTCSATSCMQRRSSWNGKGFAGSCRMSDASRTTYWALLGLGLGPRHVSCTPPSMHATYGLQPPKIQYFP